MSGLGQQLRRAVGALAFSVLVLAAPAHATFPGENGRLAGRVFEVPHMTIYTANPDGTDFLQLTSPFTPEGDEHLAFSPDWSPDGTRIAFGTFILRLEVLRVEIMDADGANRAVVVEGRGNPQWMPDGRRIFSAGRVRDARQRLESRLFDVEDGSSTPIGTFNNVPEELVIDGPDVSPDGTRVAFMAFSQVEECDLEEYPGEPVDCWLVDQPPDIYVVNLDGSGLTQLTQNSVDESRISWSPDGTKIAFARLSQIHTLDADDGDQTNLGVRGIHPLWSPDGQQLLFQQVPEGFFPPPDWYVMDADGSNPMKIIEGDAPGEPNVSSWQPIPNRAPQCSAVGATPNVLWPANKKLRPVVLSGATDPDGDPVTLEVTGVMQDEPVGGSHDAEAAGDESRVRVRAERDLRGDGRVYRIAFEAADDAGGSCEGTATVSVPRHRTAAAVDSAPPGYDSFGP